MTGRGRKAGYLSVISMCSLHPVSEIKGLGLFLYLLYQVRLKSLGVCIRSNYTIGFLLRHKNVVLHKAGNYWESQRDLLEKDLVVTT